MERSKRESLNVRTRHGCDYGSVMCKESNEDDTKETLQNEQTLLTNQYNTGIFSCFFLVYSSSCHAFLPLVVRPMMTMQEILGRSSFDSPEFNRSIIFSM